MAENLILVRLIAELDWQTPVALSIVLAAFVFILYQFLKKGKTTGSCGSCAGCEQNQSNSRIQLVQLDRKIK